MDIEEEVFSARLGISQNMNEASFSELYFIRDVKAHKACAVRALWQSGQMIEYGLFVCTILTHIRSIISILWMESKLI